MCPKFYYVDPPLRNLPLIEMVFDPLHVQKEKQNYFQGKLAYTVFILNSIPCVLSLKNMQKREM